MKSILLNGFKVELSSATFTAYIQDMPENVGFRPLREKIKDSWFLYWRDGKVYGLPRVSEPEQRFGNAAELNCNDHLWFLAARIADILPEKFPQYKAFRRRPFTFFGLKDEMVTSIRARVKGLPDLMSCFKIQPKFELDAKLVEFREGEIFIGLFMRVKTRWEILAPLNDLQNAGIDLQGLYVVRRNPQPGQRRLVGKIASLSGEAVYLSESFDDTTHIGVNEVWLEGSRVSFTRCVKTLVASRYQEFEEERHRQEAHFFTGPALEGLLERMDSFLHQASPMDLGAGLTCSVTDRIEVTNTTEYQSVVTAAPVEYCFDPAKTKRDRYAWNGIEKYGPFSRDTFAKKSPKILILFPDTVQGPVERFLRSLRDGVNLPNRSHYSGGLGKTFCLVNVQFDLCRVPWLGNSTRSVAQIYRETIEEYLANGSITPDAAIIVILDEHARMADIENPYLQAKALLLMAGVAVQEVRASTLSVLPNSLQYILQNISIALYAKMNGTPWTVIMT